MATPTTVKGHKYLIQIETSTPGTFAHPAMINTGSNIGITQNLETEELFDIDNPDLIGVVETSARSVDLNIDGTGVIHGPNELFWMQYAASGQPKNCKVTRLGADGWTIETQMLCTQFQIQGEVRKSATANITMKPSTAWAVEPND